MKTAKEVVKVLSCDWNDEAPEEWELMKFTSGVTRHAYSAESYILNTSYRGALRNELRQVIRNATEALAIVSGD